MATHEKNHFAEVMMDLMYDPARVKAMKASPLLVSLHRLVIETQGKEAEVIPSAELTREMQSNVRFLAYLKSVKDEGKS